MYKRMYEFRWKFIMSDYIFVLMYVCIYICMYVLCMCVSNFIIIFGYESEFKEIVYVCMFVCMCGYV